MHRGRVFAFWLTTTAGTGAAWAWGPTAPPAAPEPPVSAPAAAAPAPAARPLDAADGEGPMRPEAAALYNRGLERFGAHDFAGAIADFEAGHALEPRREFLFAEGQAKRLAGDCKGAVALYQRFLATGPTAVQANATHIALGRCAQRLAEHPEVVVLQPPRPPPPPPPPPPIWWRDPWGLGLTAAGVVSVGAGVGFIAASYAARDDAQRVHLLDPYDARWSTAESRWRVGVGALALGGALTAAGVTRFVLVERQARQARKQIVVAVGAAGLLVGGAF